MLAGLRRLIVPPAPQPVGHDWFVDEIGPGEVFCLSCGARPDEARPDQGCPNPRSVASRRVADTPPPA